MLKKAAALGFALLVFLMVSFMTLGIAPSGSDATDGGGGMPGMSSGPSGGGGPDMPDMPSGPGMPFDSPGDLVIGPSVSPGNLTVLQEGYRMVQLGWSPVLASDLALYQMDFKALTTDTWDIADAEISPFVCSYIKRGLENDTTYQFRLKAGDALGNWSEYSSIVLGTPRSSGAGIEGVFDVANRFASVVTHGKSTLNADGEDAVKFTAYVFDAENDIAGAGESVYFASSRGAEDQFIDASGTLLSPLAGNVYRLQTDASGGIVFKVKSVNPGSAAIGVGLLPGESGTTDLYAYLNGGSGATAESCGHIGTHEIKLTPSPVLSIALKASPTKLTYCYGDDIDVTGGILTVTGGSPEANIDIPLAAEMVSGYSGTTIGEQTLTVTYDEKTTTYKVNVTEAARARRITMFIGATGYVQDNVAKDTEVAPFIQDSRIFAPVRPIAEGFGFKVGWNEAAQTLTLTRSDMTVTILAGSNTITKVSGGVTTTFTADVAAFVKDGYVVLPIGAVGESVGATISWNSVTQAITFITNGDLESDQEHLTIFIGATGYIQNGRGMVTDVVPFIFDGEVFASVRLIAEAFGAGIGWNEATQTITLTRTDMALTIVVDSNIITKVAGGVTSTSTAAAPAFIKDGRIVLPLRAVGEAFGANVTWDAATQSMSLAYLVPKVDGVFDGGNRYSSVTAVDKEEVIGDGLASATVTVQVKDAGGDIAGAGESVYFASSRGAEDQFTDASGTLLSPLAGNVYRLQTDASGRVVFKVSSVNPGSAAIGVGLLPGESGTTDLYAYLNGGSAATAESCGYIGTNTVKFLSINITDISIKTYPDKLTYNHGEVLDLTGGVITITGAISADIPLTMEMVSGYSSTTEGEQIITVNYHGKTTTFTITVLPLPVVIPPVSPPAGGVGGGGGGGGFMPPPAVTPPVVPTAPHESPLTNPQTAADQELDKSLKETGEAVVDLTKQKNGLAEFSPGVLQEMAEAQKPLNIQGNGVQVVFSPAVKLAIVEPLQDDQIVQIGARELSTAEKQLLLANAPLGESTGIFEVGGKIFEFTAQITAPPGETVSPTKISGFSEPVSVTIDLSGLDLTEEQIKDLSGARLEKDAQGRTVPVFLGGTYDSKNKTFTFYTERFSHYSVLQKNNLIKMNLTIGSDILIVNKDFKRIDVAPSIINNRTMLPIRFVGEPLGIEFTWHEKTRTVTFEAEGKKLVLEIDKAAPGLDTPATIVSGRTLVPLRYITEAFGAQVMWFPSTRSVSVVK